MTNNENNDVIYIGDVLHVLRLARGYILVLTVIGFLAGLAMSIVSYTLSEVKKDYYVTTSIAVTSTTEDGLFSTRSDTPNSTDIRLAEEMVDSVIYVIRGDKTLDAAINEIHLIGVTPADIRSNLSMKQYKQTQIIEMTLEWNVA